jgi:hypothetical protein
MPELGPYGSVRGARSNARPYRDQRAALRLNKYAANDPSATLVPTDCRALPPIFCFERAKFLLILLVAKMQHETRNVCFPWNCFIPTRRAGSKIE